MITDPEGVTIDALSFENFSRIVSIPPFPLERESRATGSDGTAHPANALPRSLTNYLTTMKPARSARCGVLGYLNHVILLIYYHVVSIIV